MVESLSVRVRFALTTQQFSPSSVQVAKVDADAALQRQVFQVLGVLERIHEGASRAFRLARERLRNAKRIFDRSELFEMLCLQSKLLGALESGYGKGKLA